MLVECCEEFVFVIVKEVGKLLWEVCGEVGVFVVKI